MAPQLSPSEAVRRLWRVADALEYLASQFPPNPDQPGRILEVLADEVSGCAEALDAARKPHRGGPHARA